MNMLAIEFRGLIGLVSDRTASPAEVQVLFPNATQSNANWIPQALRFNQPHHPRLFVRHGSVHATSQVQTTNLQRCQDEKVETLPGVALNDFHVTIDGGLEQTALLVDRATTGNPNQMGTNVTSCDYTADMEDLASLAEPELGAVSAELLQPDYAATPQRMVARMVLTAGGLRTGAIWKDKGVHPLVRFIPHPVPGLHTTYEVYLAEHVLLTADLDGPAVFGLRALDDRDATPQRLALQPPAKSNLLHLIVENSASSACDLYDPHFLGHYLLRDGWEETTKVRIPDVSGWSDPSGDNAQCSPTDHQG